MLNNPWQTYVGEYQFTISSSNFENIFFYNNCSTASNLKYGYGYFTGCDNFYWFNDGTGSNKIILWDNGANIYGLYAVYFWNFPGQWSINQDNWIVWNFNNLNELTMCKANCSYNCNVTKEMTNYSTIKLCDKRTFELDGYDAFYFIKTDTTQILLLYYWSSQTIQLFSLITTTKSWSCDNCTPIL